MFKNFFRWDITSVKKKNYSVLICTHLPVFIFQEIILTTQSEVIKFCSLKIILDFVGLFTFGPKGIQSYHKCWQLFLGGRVKLTRYSLPRTYFLRSLGCSVLRPTLESLLSSYWRWPALYCVASRLSLTDTCTFSRIQGRAESWARLHWTPTAAAPPALCLHKPVKVACKISYLSE